MVELNTVEDVGNHTYKIYGKHHLPHKGERKLVATVKMNFRENSLSDCMNLPVLFMNAQVYRDENLRLRHEVDKQAKEIETLRGILQDATAIIGSVIPKDKSIKVGGSWLFVRDIWETARAAIEARGGKIVWEETL